MKQLTGLIVTLAIVMWCSPAMALDTGACTDGRWWYPEGQNCIGLLTPEDMGSFDTDGIWQWDSEFVAESDPWSSYANPDWQRDWQPYMEFAPGYTRLDTRHREGKPVDTRLVFSGGDAVGSPMLWRVQGPDGEPPSHFFGYFMPPPDCDPSDPDNTACDEPWTQLVYHTIIINPVSAADIASATWNEITLTGPFHDYFVDYQFLRYEMGPNLWKDTGWGEYSTTPEIYFPSFGPVTPPLGLTDVAVVLKDGRQIDLVFEVTNDEDMPTVTALSDTRPCVVHARDNDGDRRCKRKKAKKGKRKPYEVENLTARELDDALVIQWSEPDGALTRPGMKLRVYVGDSWGLENGLYDRDTFLFLDSPVQTGTVVVPADIWGPFKQKMKNMDRTFVYVAGMYRFQTKYEMDNGWVTDFHNRGYFEYITFPIP